jgi:manganese transport protein
VVPLVFFDFVAVHRFQTFIAKAKIDIQNHSPHSLKLQFSGSYTKKEYWVAVDFSSADEVALNNAFELNRSNTP